MNPRGDRETELAGEESRAEQNRAEQNTHIPSAAVGLPRSSLGSELLCSLVPTPRCVSKVPGFLFRFCGTWFEHASPVLLMVVSGYAGASMRVFLPLCTEF
ncbi:hypothetical protein MFRU_013g01520 [Monilinia fructicola]|nr:hypothetical protein MFRU_013g01520 [Monilinia fructicola]